MRKRDSVSRHRVLGQAAFVLFAAGMAASCSNASRLSEPFFTGSTDNQREIIGQADAQPMPAALPAGATAVTRSELPPPPATSQPRTQLAYNSQSYGWTAVGGEVTTVRPGQTLDMLASKYGVPPQQILSANQLRSPADIRAGRVIVIPHRVALSPETAAANRPTPVAYTPPAAPAAPAAPARAATAHVVVSGDTLYSISRRYGTTVPQLVALNALSSPDSIRLGQTLRINGTAPAATIAATTPKPKQPVSAPVRVASIDPKIKLKSPADTASPPMAPTANAPAVPAAPTVPVSKGKPDRAATVAAIDKAADAGSTSGTDFRWPVRGRIIAGFGSKPNGEKNDGINLAVPEGTAVKAAEAGTVIYAGNELAGYGNLILVRHANGWVSAYAHNRDIGVKRGDAVRRGQTIAHAGRSGSVSSPQVHFELRKGAKPVNPLDYLAT